MKSKETNNNKVNESKDYIKNVLYKIMDNVYLSNNSSEIKVFKIMIEVALDKCTTIDKIINVYKMIRNDLYKEIFVKRENELNIDFDIKVNFNEFNNYEDFLDFINNKIPEIVGTFYQKKIAIIIKNNEQIIDFKMSDDLKIKLINIFHLKINGYEFYKQYENDIKLNKMDKVISNIQQDIYLLFKRYNDLIINNIFHILVNCRKNKLESSKELLGFLGKKNYDILNILLFHEYYVRNLVKKDSIILSICPDEIVDNESFMIDLFKEKRDIVKYLRKLKYNQKFSIKVYEITKSIEFFKFFDKSIFTEEFLLYFIEIDVRILKYVPYLFNDKNFMLLCIRKNYESINYIGKELEKDCDFLKQVHILYGSKIKSFIKKINIGGYCETR